MKRFLRFAALILICLFIVVLLFALIFLRGMGDVMKIEITDIDLSKISDGEYFGKFESGRWQYYVKVFVSNREIKNVEILNDKCGFIDMDKYDDVNIQVISRVLERQSLRIDAVTVATINTKALLKAIENALVN
ncbi:MAG: FMN-binding protein [Pseudothermotoga sp.]